MGGCSSETYEMGQRQDKDEIEYGNDCLLGYNLAAPLWLLGKTPKYVYIRFSQIKKCNTPECVNVASPPNDRVFKLTQEDENPCKWSYTNDWMVHWLLHQVPPTWVEFEAYHYPSSRYYFYAFYNANERDPRFTANEWDCGVYRMCGYEGIARVSWKLESLKVMDLLNIKPQKDLFMEMRPKEDGSRVYKYCKLSQSTNIKILYAPG